MHMGIFVGLLTAFGASALNVFLKQLSDFTPNFLSWVRFTAASLSLALIIWIFIGWEFPPLAFWLIVLFAKVPIEILLAWLSTKSVQISDISIVGPLNASLSSIFLIPVGFFILGELPTLIGFIGVLSIIGGSFFLGQKEGEKFSLKGGLLELLRDRGVRLAIIAAFVASIAISVTKFSFQYVSNPLIAAVCASASLAIILVPHAFTQKKIALHKNAKPLGGLWLTSSVSIALHNYGLSLMPAVYFISIKRLSILFDVVFGRVFFKEAHVEERFIGAVCMVLGIVLIAFG